jgi:hypothetical protein
MTREQVRYFSRIRLESGLWNRILSDPGFQRFSLSIVLILDCSKLDQSSGPSWDGWKIMALGHMQEPMHVNLRTSATLRVPSKGLNSITGGVAS